MNVLLAPIGSHGDVHPFVALGMALRDRGHQVRLITNGHFKKLVREAGLEFIELGSDEEYRQAIDNPDLWHPLKGFRLINQFNLRLMRPLYEKIAEYYRAGKLLVAAPVNAYGARVAQEALGVPLVSVVLQPSIIGSAYELPVWPGYSFMRLQPRWMRQVSLRALGALMIDPLLAPGVNAFRAELGLKKPVRRFVNWWLSNRCILGLFPSWYAQPQPDWPQNTALTGFPLFDERGHAAFSPEVSDFLQAGEPPVVFTAGSAMLHGDRFFKTAVDVCLRLERRGILLARFSDQIPADLPETVRHFEYVPFGDLLPRAAALVHHGGIGTTSQGLAAGIPHLVTPRAFDQPDNAARLKRLGVGLSISPDRFRPAAAARIIASLLDQPRVRDRCQEIAARMRQEHPIEQACEVIERACDQA